MDIVKYISLEQIVSIMLDGKYLEVFSFKTRLIQGCLLLYTYFRKF